MNPANTKRSLLGPDNGTLRRDSISRTAITLYTVTFFAPAFFGFGFSGWLPFIPMAAVALIPIIAGPRIYRVAGAIALLTAVGGYFEFRETPRDAYRIPITSPDAK